MSPAEEQALRELRRWGVLRKLARDAAADYDQAANALCDPPHETTNLVAELTQLRDGPISKLVDALNGAVSACAQLTEAAADRMTDGTR